jgi:hypothetical protein
MPQDLIGFWNHCRLTAPPFIHPDDLPIIRENARLTGDADPVSFETYVSGPRFDPGDNCFHFSLFPVPFVGDLRSASVVILMLNPGFRYSDYWAEIKVPEFRARLEANLRQSFDGVEYPFLYLDPQFCWHTGFRWWEGKLRDVILKIAKERFNGRYLQALQFLSRNVACIELIPYHSASFTDHQLIQKLPSAHHARSFLHDRLIPEAITEKKTVIATRQKEGWKLQKEVGTLYIYEGGHTRGASLSANSRGGEAILKRFGIS